MPFSEQSAVYSDVGGACKWLVPLQGTFNLSTTYKKRIVSHQHPKRQGHIMCMVCPWSLPVSLLTQKVETAPERYSSVCFWMSHLKLHFLSILSISLRPVITDLRFFEVSNCGLICSKRLCTLGPIKLGELFHHTYFYSRLRLSSAHDTASGIQPQDTFPCMLAPSPQLCLSSSRNLSWFLSLRTGPSARVLFPCEHPFGYTNPNKHSMEQEVLNPLHLSHWKQRLHSSSRRGQVFLLLTPIHLIFYF